MKKLLVAALFAAGLMIIPKTKTEAGTFKQISYVKDSVPPMGKDTSAKKWKSWKKDSTSMKSMKDSTK